jgi:YfiH family protein
MTLTNLSPLQSALFSKTGGVAHGVTRRIPGVQPAEANISYTAPRDRVEAWRMRQLWSASMGIDAQTLAVPYQVHGSGVAIVRRRQAGSGAAPGSKLVAKADGVITGDEGVALMTTHADCLPMLLYAPETRVVAAVHAGWRSTVTGVTRNTLRTMYSVFHVDPDEVLAFIGPAICRACYEVGPEVERAWSLIDPSDSASAIVRTGDRLSFDLVAANRQFLIADGVQPENIEESGFCTRCHGDQWFTHRGQGPLTGRFGAIISLNGRY